MPIKFRPHAVITYYNGSREAVAVDFTPTLSFDLDEFEREADRRGATYFVVQVFSESLAVIASLYAASMKICAGIVLFHRWYTSCN